MNRILLRPGTNHRPTQRKVGIACLEGKKGLRGRTLALMAVIAVVLAGLSALGGADSAWADGAGNVDTFAKDLPMAEVHLDPAKLKNASKVDILNNDFAVKDGYVVLNKQLESNEYYPDWGAVVEFTFADAAILPDGSRGDVSATLNDLYLMTGPAGAAKGDTSKHENLAGVPAVAKADGTEISARVLSSSETGGSTEWRYGFRAGVDIRVAGSPAGSFVWGATGVTVDRSGIAAFQNLPDSEYYGHFSESVGLAIEELSAPVYYPQENYAARVGDYGDSMMFSGGGVNGAEQTGIDGKTWDKSFLTGFLTEVPAHGAAAPSYICGGGLSGTETYATNMPIFPEDGSYAFVTSSGRGGRIEFTKDGGDLNDGSAVLGAGHYSAPRGKSVRLTMTPWAEGAKPVLRINGTDVSAQIVRHGEGANVYYTYDVPAVFADTTAQVFWVG